MKKVVRWTVHILLILAILALIVFFLYPKITGKIISRSVSRTSISTEPIGDCYCACVSTEGLGILITKKKVRGKIPEGVCDAISGEGCTQIEYVDNIKYIYEAEWGNCYWDSIFTEPEDPDLRAFKDIGKKGYWTWHPLGRKGTILRDAWDRFF